MPAWARNAVQAAEALQIDEVSDAYSGGSLVGTSARQDLRDVLSHIVFDEVPGKDESLGTPGQVVSGKQTTVFETTDGVTEFATSLQADKMAYGKVNQNDGSFSLIDVRHKDGTGSLYNALFAGPGAFTSNGKPESLITAFGIVRDQQGATR